MSIQPRLVYPSQPNQYVSFIPNMHVITTLPQSQAQLVASQPLQAIPSTSDPQV